MAIDIAAIGAGADGAKQFILVTLLNPLIERSPLHQDTRTSRISLYQLLPCFFQIMPVGTLPDVVKPLAQRAPFPGRTFLARALAWNRCNQEASHIRLL